MNKHEVEYLLVGGHALAFHGWPRFTKDIDFWVNATQENAQRILKVLDDFGFGDTDLKEEDLATLGKVIQLGFPPNRIDLVTSIDGVEFKDAWPNRIQSEYAGLPLLVINKNDLIANKKSTGREQDLLDVKKLLAIDD